MKWCRYSREGETSVGLIQDDSVVKVEGTPWGQHTVTGQIVPLANVKLELALLEQTWRDSGCAAREVAADERALQEVNERLWDIEDRIRDKEAKQSFDRDFIELARAVYVCNDERAAIKKRVNIQLGSRLIEEKSYRQYR